MIYLEAGKGYMVRVVVTNRSTRGGQPAAASLGMKLSAAIDSLEGTVMTWQADFGPGQILPFTSNFIIPQGDAGKSGAVKVSVQAPDGSLIGDEVLGFTVRLASVSATLAWRVIKDIVTGAVAPLPLVLSPGILYEFQAEVTNSGSVGSDLVVDIRCLLGGYPIEALNFWVQDHYLPGETKRYARSFSIPAELTPGEGDIEVSLYGPDSQGVINALLAQKRETLSARPKVGIIFSASALTPVTERSYPGPTGMLVGGMFDVQIVRQNVGLEQASLYRLVYGLERAGQVRNPVSMFWSSPKVSTALGDVIMRPGETVTDRFTWQTDTWWGGFYDLRILAVDRYVGVVGELFIPNFVYVAPGYEEVLPATSE